MCASVVVQLCAATVLGGRLHHDEVHQTIEQAHRLAYGFGAVPHEYLSGMRNWLAPGALALFFSLLRSLGVGDARLIIALTHGLVGALSLGSITSTYELVLSATGSRPHARLGALSLALWVPSANLAFRTLGEGFTVVTLMAALAAISPPSGEVVTARRAFTAGLWVGIGFALRYAAGVYALPIALVLALRGRWRALWVFCAGVALVIAGLGALDWLTWGEPWHSVWAYADYNIVRGRARIDYGSQPLWFYPLCALGFSPVGLLALGALRQWRRAALPLAVAGAYLAVMSLLAHKETRFFLPVVPALIAAAVIAQERWSPRRGSLALSILGLQSLGALGVMYFANICQGPEARAAMWIGRQPDVGAVATLTTYHPGYVLLRRDVPVYYDPRANAHRALTLLESRWVPPAAGRFYVYGARMPAGARHRLDNIGFSRVHTEQLVDVWAR